MSSDVALASTSRSSDIVLFRKAMEDFAEESGLGYLFGDLDFVKPLGTERFSSEIFWRVALEIFLSPLEKRVIGVGRVGFERLLQRLGDFDEIISEKVFKKELEDLLFSLLPTSSHERILKVLRSVHPVQFKLRRVKARDFDNFMILDWSGRFGLDAWKLAETVWKLGYPAFFSRKTALGFFGFPGGNAKAEFETWTDCCLTLELDPESGPSAGFDLNLKGELLLGVDPADPLARAVGLGEKSFFFGGRAMESETASDKRMLFLDRGRGIADNGRLMRSMLDCLRRGGEGIAGDWEKLRFDYKKNFASAENVKMREEDAFEDGYFRYVVFWRAFGILSERLQSSAEIEEVEAGDPVSVFHFLRKRFGCGKQECFYVLLLNNRNRLMEALKIAEGVLDQVITHSRDVFEPAIRLKAKAVIIAHNHPSGDTTPSRHDKQLTENLRKAGELLGIRVLDHLIFTDQKAFSFSRENLL